MPTTGNFVFPFATEIKCKYSPVPSDDHIRKENGTCTGGALIGSTCQLSCDTGFILSTGGNSTTRTCQLYCSTERWVIWQNICNYFYSTKWHPLNAPSCLGMFKNLQTCFFLFTLLWCFILSICASDRELMMSPSQCSDSLIAKNEWQI